ncbi:hypothetical protein E4T56_gene20664 [Termitomyces sp. T112]|nr:hypothetical protein E4T56_gene20664 [Termitomyces sp. T112]
MGLCLNPAKPIPLPHNLSSTPPDLPGLAWINFPWLSSQVPSVWNTSEHLVVSVGNHVHLHARMPPHNDTTVPKWDESRPRELPQYFKELEYLFADCGITDDTQKKEYASQYVSYDTAETCLGLPEFGNNIGNNAP